MNINEMTMELLVKENEALKKALISSNTVIFSVWKNTGSLGCKSKYNENIELLAGDNG